MSRRLAGIPLRLEFTNSARKELGRLALEDANRLVTALLLLAATGEGNIRPLQGYKNTFRLEEGDTRAEFWVIQTDSLIQVIRVFYRQEGYKTKGRKRR